MRSPRPRCNRGRQIARERYARAASLAVSVVREMDPRDGFVAMACDVDCAVLGEVGAPGDAAADAVATFLAGIEPDGGSNPSRWVEAAATATASDPRDLRVLVLGDGTPTVGPLHAATLDAAVREVLPPRASVVAVPLGADADVVALGALARAGGGVVVPFVAGRRVEAAAMEVLGAAYGTVLVDPVIELPAGVTAVSPARLEPLLAGRELFVLGRLPHGQSAVGDVVISGTVAGQPFVQRYPTHAVVTSAAGNAFVPRLYASARIAELEAGGRAEDVAAIVALSKRWRVASRHTSLLVLESQAMFDAFGLDRTHSAPMFTGDDEAIGENTDVIDEGSSAVAAHNGVTLSIIRGTTLTACQGCGRTGTESGATHAPTASRAARPPPPADPPPPSRRGFVPMRKVWDRHARFDAQRADESAFGKRLGEARSAWEEAPDSRDRTMSWFRLLFAAGRMPEAREVLATWAGRDALDPEVLVARADLAALSGDRDAALRILSGLADVRPGDRLPHVQLAGAWDRLGDDASACAHRVALAELDPSVTNAVGDALRCTRALGRGRVADALLASVPVAQRSAAEAASTRVPAGETVSGDVRITARWTGDVDLDVALIDKDGRRIGWYGVPHRRAVPTARGAADRASEELALRKLPSGTYAVQIARATPGKGEVRGSLDLVLPDGTEARDVPFVLTDDAVALGYVQVWFTDRLVPL